MQNKISAKVYIEEGNQLRQAGELTRAKEKYTVALQLNPQSVPALNQLGKIYEQEQDYDRAIPYLQQIIEHKPNNSKFQQRLAEALMEIKDFPGAVEAYQNAILLKPENSKSLCSCLAEALAKQGEASEAIAVYQNLLRSEAVEIPEDKFPLGEAIVQLSIRQSKLAEGENPGGVMKQVFNFLDLPDYQDIQYSYKNKGSYSAKIDEDLLSRLYDFYRPHNQRLEDFIGRKFNWEP